MSVFSRLLILCLLSSFAIHLIMGGGVYRTKLPDSSQNQPVEFEVKYAKSKQFVRETHAKDNINRITETPFLSKFQKHFKEQTRASKFGITENKGKQSARKKQSTQKSYDANSYILTSDKKSVGQSTISEHIPNVKQGFVTALNTNKEFFYTFFERTSEQIINRWQFRVSNIVSSLNAKGLKKYSYKPQVSSIEVLLTPEGHFHKVYLNQPAQLKLFDQAAINSFKKASPFLNPPKGLVEEDGFIHLKYSFRVDLKPYRIIRQRQ